MLRGSLLVFLSRNFQKLIGFAILLLLGRALDRQGYGVYGTLVTVLGYVTTLGSAGLGPAHVYLRGQERLDLRRLMGNALAGAALFGALSVAVFLLVAPALDWGLLAEWGVLFVSVVFPVVILQSYLDYVWLGEDRMGTYSGLYAARFVTQLLLLAAGVLVPATQEGRYLGMAAALVLNPVLSVCASLLLIHRRYGLRTAFERAAFTGAVKYGLHVQAGSAAQAIGYRFDVILINVLLGAAAVAPYRVATGFAEILWLVPAALSTALLPRVSTGDREQARRVTAQTCRIVFALGVLAAAAVFVLAEPALRLAFEEKYLGAVAPLRILLVGITVFSVQKVLANYFIGQGRAAWFQRATLLSMAVNLGLNLWLVPMPGWGITGAALASTVSYSLSTGIMAVLFARWSGLPLRAVFVPVRGDAGDVLARAARLRARGTRLLHRGAVR